MKILFILLFVLATTITFSQINEFETYLIELKDDFQVEQIQPDSLKYIDPLLLDIRESEEYEVQ